MNDCYKSFIATAKELAAANGLRWDPPCDATGKILNEADRWDLMCLRGLPSPPNAFLAHLGYPESGLAALNLIRADRSLQPIQQKRMPTHWRDFHQAVIIHELLVKKNKPKSSFSVDQASRLLAMCADGTVPWRIDSEIVQLAYNAALRVEDSGKSAITLASLIKGTFDSLCLADRFPLARFCIPYNEKHYKERQAQVEMQKDLSRNYLRVDSIRKNLNDRKRDSRLPDERAFWELVRIVFTETPLTFADAINFAQVKVAIVTGFRVGEIVSIPADWERWREYFDARGQPAGQRGGISRSLMIRNFAEKQANDEGNDGVVLFEAVQHVPPMFENLILETLSDVARLTQPMRENLKRQIETGRFLPDFDPDDLVHAGEMYTRLTGSPKVSREPIPRHFIDEYQKNFDQSVLEQIRDHQLNHARANGWDNSILHPYWSRYFVRNGRDKNSVRPLTKDGKRFRYRSTCDDVFLGVGDVEAMIRNRLPNRQSDIQPFNLDNGAKLYPTSYFS